MKRLILLSSFLFLFSCVSEHEQDAINELSSLGGEIIISNGVTSSTTDGTRKIKKISVTGTEAIEQGIVERGLIASKYAFVVFHKLDDSERDFDKVEVMLNKSNGTSFVYEVSKTKLEVIEKEYVIIDKWISALKNNEFEKCYSFLNKTNRATPEFETFKRKFEYLNKKYGTINLVWFDGFAFEEVNDPDYQGEVHQLIYDFSGKNDGYAIHFFLHANDPEMKIQGLTFNE